MYVIFVTLPVVSQEASSHCPDSTQLLDELAMIYTTCIMFYAVFSYGKTQSTKILIGFLVSLLAVSVSLYYHYLKDPLFHQNTFALLTLIVFIRCFYVMEITLQPSARDKNTGASTERARVERRDRAILKTMKRWMMPAGLGSIALAFLIWNLDNAFCGILRRWRRDVGLPWGILLEGHGWW